MAEHRERVFDVLALLGIVIALLVPLMMVGEHGLSLATLFVSGGAVALGLGLTTVVNRHRSALEKIVLACPHCTKRLRVGVHPGKTLLVTCPRRDCRGRFEYEHGKEPRRCGVKVGERDTVRAAKRASSDQLCPFCRDLLHKERTITCESCPTESHASCIDEFGPRCPVCRGLVEVKARKVRG